jgi:hypothetical protein
LRLIVNVALEEEVYMKMPPGYRQEGMILRLNKALYGLRQSPFESVDVLVVRNGEEMLLKLNTIPDDDVETSHLALLCGLVLHKPHRAVRQQMKKLPSEVYIASRKHGSPADVYCRLYPTKFITHLNDTPTPTLEAVLEVARKIPDNTCKTALHLKT